VVKGFGGVGAGVRFKSFPSIIPLKFMTRKADGRIELSKEGVNQFAFVIYASIGMFLLDDT